MSAVRDLRADVADELARQTTGEFFSYMPKHGRSKERAAGSASGAACG